MSQLAQASSSSGSAASAPASLAGLGRAELSAKLAELGVPAREQRMRLAQLWHWIYHRGATDFASMTTIGKEMRSNLAAAFSLDRPKIVSEHVSSDGTRKWLLRMAPKGPGDKGAEIETVYIPEVDRATLCVSSQVGCTLTCTFCHTGTQRLVRNLDAAEIVGQLLVAARDRRLAGGPAGDGEALPARLIQHRVHGHGRAALQFRGRRRRGRDHRRRRGPRLLAPADHALDLGRRPDDPARRREIGTMLAVSPARGARRSARRAGAAQQEIPDRELLDACRAYPGLSNARRITFEYVMLKGVNDTPADARELVRLLRGIPAKINLIPFNPWPGARHECSDWERIEAFAEIVFNAGYASPIRTPRGRDILAACGQLKSETEKLRARARLMLESGIGAEGLFAGSQ